MKEIRRLPIKIVLQKETDFRRPMAGGGKTEPFCDVTPTLRKEFVDQFGQVHDYFSEAFAQKPNIAGVAKVILRPKALAKSHRPTSLFDKKTCPIIGVQGFGELLISVQPEGLRKISNKILEDESSQGIFSISTIEKIEPFTISNYLGSETLNNLKDQIKSNHKANLKFRLFRHLDPSVDSALFNEFQYQISELGLGQPIQLNYGPSALIYNIRNVTSDLIEPLANFIGTQNLSLFPKYNFVRTASTSLRPVEVEDFPLPESNKEYGIVGIIDTGTNPNDPNLSPWIVNREVFIPADKSNYDHGSFVAGLIVHSRRLNNNSNLFPDVSSKIIDIAAIPEDGTTEDELLSILEEVLPKYPQVKVWNLSLGTTGQTCQDDTFSDFAMALDALQDKYGVTFVLAAGNYTKPPLRGWPPLAGSNETDRICPPADSIRAITVGSLSHIDNPNSRVRAEEPSPFSRRGPGPSFIPKPEVVHYGGNCNEKGNYTQTGIISLNGTCNIAEDIGTSFSAPIVSSLLANITQSLSNCTRSLAKALLIHSAALQSETYDAQSLRYRGFGVPSEPLLALTCDPWSATLIFETQLVSGIEFEKTPFPIPQCLRTPDNRIQGNFTITLVYEPPIDSTYGSEYCRTNLEVSFGTYDVNPKSGKIEHIKKIPAQPLDVKKMYERQLIEHGFKWSPVKVYRRNLKTGVSGQNWRLLVKLHNRSGFSSSMPQPVALVVTISDPERHKPVYNDIVTEMNQLGWATVDLQVHQQIRNFISK